MQGGRDGFDGGGNGVELPGAGLDGVRRDFDKMKPKGEHWRSESAMRRAEEPGGLALAPVEPQARRVQ